jgi:hypothetical protein
MSPLAKTPSMNRKVSRPRLSLRKNSGLRDATLIEQKMITLAATILSLKEKKLTIDSLHDIFGRVIYTQLTPVTPRELKARPILRRIAKMNKLIDWTK